MTRCGGTRLTTSDGCGYRSGGPDYGLLRRLRSRGSPRTRIAVAARPRGASRTESRLDFEHRGRAATRPASLAAKTRPGTRVQPQKLIAPIELGHDVNVSGLAPDE